MSHGKHLGKLLNEVRKDMEKAPALSERKSPLVAAIVGFFFGPIGVGIYLKSWRDFFICLAVLVILLFTVALAPIGWLFSAAYGGYRAYTSNENL